MTTGVDARRPGAAPPAARSDHAVVRAGRVAWALLGIVGLLVLGRLAATRLAVVVVPLLLALLPAALLAPAVG